MKHSTRLAALMAAAAIFAFLPGAQVCGQSPRHGGGGGHHSSVSGGSHSSGHSSTYSHGSSSGSHSRSGGSYSGGSSSHRSSGSVASGSHNKPSHSSGSGVSSSSQHRPSGGGVSSSSSSSGSIASGSHNKPQRPSGGSVSGSQSRPSGSSGNYNRPSGGSVSGSNRPSRPSGSISSDRPANRPSDIRDHASRVPDTRSGDRRPDVRPNGGDRRPDVRPNGGDRRPDVNPGGGARRPGGYNDGVYRSRPASPAATKANRPAPGSRPYADGSYGRGHGAPAPARVHSNPGGHRPPAHRPAPREVHGTPYHFSRHGHHHYGHYLPAPPPRYVVRHYWGRDYYYYNDIWYSYHHGRYWICRPPWGYVFSPLADAVYTACTFAYYFDRIHYYDTINENASTIVAQNETIAANNAVIASQNETIARNAALAEASGDLAKTLGLVQSYASADTEYFYNDGVFYVKSADGQYTVIVPPAGALVETLPDDYETIELGGQTYFKVDDTIYRTAVVDGKAMFEVLGQLMQ